MKEVTIKWILIAYFSCLQVITIQAQSTPINCACQVDTMGLATYLATLNLSENNPLKFEVQNAAAKFAVLHGTIGPTTPSRVQAFISNYPNVTTLVFMSMPGSEDDDANLIAARALRNRGYTTFLPAVQAYDTDAFIASGAVDMFLSGTTRVIDIDGEVGVHAWAEGNGTSATDYPVGHAVHQSYIDYYVEMGFSQADAEAFYYFTINAASANDIHNMSEAELEQYRLRTCKRAANCESNTCENEFVLTTQNLPDGELGTIHRMAVNTIESGVATLDNSNVTYSAGQSITLKAGFQTGNNALFHAYIAACTMVSEKPVSIVATSIKRQVEKEFILSENPKVNVFPNPVSSSTNIHFFLAQAGTIQLVITNAQGQKVRTLEQMSLVKGWHTSKYNAMDLPKGVYFLTLNSVNKVVTQKILRL